MDSELHKRASAGDAEAQYDLGSNCYLGFGTPQNYEEAAKWFRKAAEQGHPPGQPLLDELHKEGRITHTALLQRETKSPSIGKVFVIFVAIFLIVIVCFLFLRINF